MRAASRFDFGNALSLLDLNHGRSRAVQGLSAHARIADSAWSADESRVAFSLWGAKGVELWLLDVASARARRLGDFHLNAATGPGFAWLGQQLLVKLVPTRQGPAPRAPAAPDGPNIQQSEGGALSQTRTYPDLLKTAYDADLLDYQLQSQLALLGMDGKLSLIGQPERYLGVSGAPNRQYLLTTRLQRPIPRWCRCRAFPSASMYWIGRDASCAPWPSGRCWNACLPAMTRWRPVRAKWPGAPMRRPACSGSRHWTAATLAAPPPSATRSICKPRPSSKRRANGSGWPAASPTSAGAAATWPWCANTGGKPGIESLARAPRSRRRAGTAEQPQIRRPL